MPLAYVRRIIVTRPYLAAPPDPPLPAKPGPSGKRALARWEERRQARLELVALRETALRAVGQSVVRRLGRLPGLVLADDAPTAAAAWGGLARSPRPGQGDLLEALGSLAAVGQAAGADAVVAISMDRFGTQTSLDRELWVRIRGWLVPCDSRPAQGPFLCYGWSRTARQLLTGRFPKSDEELAEAAADGAARQLARVLATGEQSPFAGGVRLAFVPAAVPSVARSSRTEGGQTAGVPLPSLVRQRDVLLQPEAGPAALVCEPEDVEGALRGLGLDAADVWTDAGTPSLDTVVALARRLRAAYVLVSRIVDAEVTERAIDVTSDGHASPGVERRARVEAQASFIETSTRLTLWSDQTTGESVARTEYVRQQQRVRTAEQCVYDAARAAFAYLRSGFDQYRRHYER